MAMYAATADRLMACCLRHAGPQGAEDAVAETYAVAWRRRHQLPDDALPWLIVTARNCIHSQRRSARRQSQLSDRIAGLSQLAASPADVGVQRRDEILTALDWLPEDDREALLLIAWDGLSVRDAAQVLGTTPGALRVRIHRARARLRARHTEGAFHD